MAAPPFPRARAVRGLTWAVRGLGGFLLLCLVTIAVLLILVPLYDLPSPNLYEPGQLANTLNLFSIFLIALGIVSGLTFSAGLAGLYGPREALGQAHAASVVQTKLWLGVMLVLLGAAIVVPSITFPLLTFPGIGYTLPSWTWSASVVLAGLRAIFGGLILYYAVQGLAEEDERVRLLVAMTLGMVGAIVWSGLAAYASALGGMSIDSLLAFLTGAVAGLGTSAISIGLFMAVYREIRRGLEAGGHA